jgi:hypothetical protein
LQNLIRVRQRKAGRRADRQRHSGRGMQAEACRQRHAGRGMQAGGLTGEQIELECRLAGWQDERMADRLTGRQTDRQRPYGQTER